MYSKTVTGSENKKSRPLKLTYKEQKEFEAIDGRIAKVENDLKNVNLEISNTSSDYARLQELLKNKEEIESDLNEAFERWTYLNELVEEIEKNKQIES